MMYCVYDYQGILPNYFQLKKEYFEREVRKEDRRVISVNLKVQQPSLMCLWGSK